MNDTFKNLYETVLSRRDSHTEGSYTCYLFEQGLDKILKKCGEDGTFPVADKLKEMCDYYGFDGYFINQEESISMEEVEAELDKRSNKTGNLKKFHTVDKNS